MFKWISHPGLSANQTRSVFGGATSSGGPGVTPGTTAVAANSWMPRDVNISVTNHRRPAATGVGNDFTLSAYDGGSAVTTFTFGNSDGTSKTTVHSPAGTLTAATSAAISQIHLHEHILGAGAASAAGGFAIIYQDASNDALSYHCAGDGTNNLAVGATDEFVAVYGTGSGSTTENNAEVVWPTTGTLSNFGIRYDTGADNSYNLLVRVNGATSGSAIPLAIAATGGLVINTSSHAIVAGQTLSFGLTRTAGASTEIQIVIVFTFESSE